MTGLDKDIFRAIRKLTTLLNEACNHWNYLCPYLEELGIAADRALEGYKRDYPKDVKSLIAEKSAPPRNCDIGTAEEQDKRFAYQFCRVGIEGCTKCKLNTLKHRGNTCGIYWAQMPYEEGGVK